MVRNYQQYFECRTFFHDDHINLRLNKVGAPLRQRNLRLYNVIATKKKPWWQEIVIDDRKCNMMVEYFSHDIHHFVTPENKEQHHLASDQIILRYAVKYIVHIIRTSRGTKPGQEFQTIHLRYRKPSSPTSHFPDLHPWISPLTIFIFLSFSCPWSG